MTQPPSGEAAQPGASQHRCASGSAQAGGANGSCVLLVGQGRLADGTAEALRDGGVAVRRLEDPSDAQIIDALSDESIDRAVVISRYDHVSLRQALVVAHVRSGLSMLVTVFDRDVAAHLRENVGNVRVLSMADIVAPSLAGPCLDPGLISVVRRPSNNWGVEAVDGKPAVETARWETPGWARRAFMALQALLAPYASSARILVYGLLGFVAVLVAETAATMVSANYSLVDALYTVAKVTVTVGPSSAADEGKTWFKLFSTVSMLLTLGFAAVLTAGLVDRLLDPRLTGIVGKSAVPRRDHVVVVGFGQVGFRLALLLRELGVPVVVVEQNTDAKNVPRGKDQRLPIVIGSGASQRLLRRLSIGRARAVAAVTSDEVENIAIAIAARGVRQDINIALRAGDVAETGGPRWLFGLGMVRDVYRIAAAALAATILSGQPYEAFPFERVMYLVDEKGAISTFGETVGSASG